MASDTTATLESLPAELLYTIHLFCLSPSLPLLSRSFHQLFAHSSTHHRASYLLARHPEHTLFHAVRYPLCDLSVLLMLERLASSRSLKLRCHQLPRRIVRPLASSPPGEVDFALIQHLLDKYNASPDGKHGYLLARAVFHKHLPLIRLLLRAGADPGMQDGYSVIKAIESGDEPLVRLLLERGGEEEEEEDEGLDEEETERVGKKGRKRRRSSSSGGKRKIKRRKLELRTEPTSVMLRAAVERKNGRLIDYLMEIGARPSMDVLKLL